MGFLIEVMRRMNNVTNSSDVIELRSSKVGEIQDIPAIVRGGAIRIRAATEADLSQLIGLVHSLAKYENLEHLMTATEEGLREALFGAAQPAAEVLLAFIEDKCVGYMILFTTFCAMLAAPRGIFLENLYVLPECRGNGVGEALLGRLAVIAKERNCVRIDWRCLHCNESAIGFYKSQGAVAMTDWTPFRMDEAAIHELSRKTQGKEMLSRLYEENQSLQGGF